MLNGRSEAIVIVTALFLALSLVTVGLRCFVRARVVRAFGLDDWTMVAAMVLNIVFATVGIVGSFYGMGQKTEYFTTRPDHFRRAALVKPSLGLNLVTALHGRLIGAVLVARPTLLRDHLRRCENLHYHLVAAHHHQPNPHHHPLRRHGPDRNCRVDLLLLHRFPMQTDELFSVVAAITDFTIGLLPVFIIWSLRMNTRTKMAIAGILGLGCLAGAAVIVRIPFIPQYKDHDFFYATYQISIWSNVEAGLGITAGSLTTLRPLVRFLRDGSSASRSHHRSPGSYPLSSNIPKGMSRKSKPERDREDAQRLWTGLADEGYRGATTTTTITGSHPTKRASEGSLTS